MGTYEKYPYLGFHGSSPLVTCVTRMIPVTKNIIIIIIIIILIHYHKGLSAVGLSLPTDSLGLQSIIACVLCPKGVFRLCKAIEKSIQLGAGERGGGTERGNVRVDCLRFLT